MKQVRIGLLGVAHRANIADYWQKDKRAVVTAGCDTESKYLETFQEKHGKETFVTNDYKELIARDDLDVIAIFTPDNLHEEHAVAALNAGKDVFLEKPMAITVEGCQAIIDAEKSSGKKLMVGFNCRYMPVFNIMKDIIDAGTLGKIKAVWVRHFVGFGGWAYFHDYRANQKGSTSLLLQKASHDIDIIHYLTGQKTNRVVGMGNLGVFGGDKPNDLTCDVCDEKESCPDFSDRSDGPNKQMCCYRKEVDVEDLNMLLMNLSGGIQASYVQCHYTPDSWRNYTVIGSKGRLEATSNTQVVVYTQKYSKNRAGSDDHYAKAVYDVGVNQDEHGGADPIMCKAFLDYIVDDVQPRATSADGLLSVAVGVKGAESLRNGNVPIDLL